MRPAIPLLLALLLLACGGGSQEETPPPATVGADGSAPGETFPTHPFFANATYTGLFPEPVTLTDGRWEGEPYAEDGASRPSAGLVEDTYVRGPVEGFETEVAAILLWESSGGSGTRLYLAATPSTAEPVSAVLVGDRVQVRRFAAEDGDLVLDVVQAGPDDPACCPTQLAVRRFRGAGSELLETAPEITGTLSVAATLVGTRWHFASFGRDDLAPAGSDIEISFPGEGLAGISGCNRFQGAWTEEAPGEISFGPLARTLKACPEANMVLEDRFLAALARTRGYSFLGGKLALELDPADGEPSFLLFHRMD